MTPDISFNAKCGQIAAERVLTASAARWDHAQRIVAAVMGPRPTSPYMETAPYQSEASILAECERYADVKRRQREFDRRVRAVLDHLRNETRCIEDRVVDVRRAA